MTILTIRTDKPLAELSLYEDAKQLSDITWHAHRELAETILVKIEELAKSVQKQVNDIDGVVFFAGPGSFTGLRIGASVANALGASLSIPVVAQKGESWLKNGIMHVRSLQEFSPIEPFYGAEPTTTVQKK